MHKRYKNTGEDNIINLSARLFWIFNKHIKNQICFYCYEIMFLINQLLFFIKKSLKIKNYYFRSYNNLNFINFKTYIKDKE